MCKAIKNLFGIRSPSEEFVKDEPKDEVKDEPKDEVKDEPKDEVKDEPKDEVKEEVTEEAKPEEWIWLKGFKGMDKDMQARNKFQYELGKQYDMPEGATIEPCSGGFHLCLNLRHVFNYYRVGNGNRFFYVRALVRKDAVEKYGKREYLCDELEAFVRSYVIDKLAAKSIEIVRELTPDEILKSYGGDTWDEKYKQLALSISVDAATNAMRTDELVTYGYSLPFAQWLNENSKYEIAKAVGSQTDLSMDMKVLMIMNG